jgi:hypothetical protein
MLSNQNKPQGKVKFLTWCSYIVHLVFCIFFCISFAVAGFSLISMGIQVSEENTRLASVAERVHSSTDEEYTAWLEALDDPQKYSTYGETRNGELENIKVLSGLANISITGSYSMAAGSFVLCLFNLFWLYRIARAFVVLVKTRSASQALAKIYFKRRAKSKPLSAQPTADENSEVKAQSQQVED